MTQKDKFIIKSMTVEHLDKVCKISSEAFRSMSWSRETFISTLANENSVLLVAISVETQAVVGFLCATIILDEVSIDDIAVSLKYRNQGVGNLLFQEFFNLSQFSSLKCYLEVRSKNSPAIKLYEKFGFETVGFRKNYYSDPNDDAILMTRNTQKSKEGEVLSYNNIK